MPCQPLAIFPLADWAAVEAFLAKNISSRAYALSKLSAAVDYESHHIVLDPETHTVWWAYDNAPLDGDGWTIDHLAPKDVPEYADGYIDVVRNRMDDPDGYIYGGDIEDDQEALDEYAQIMLLGLPDDPRTARSAIKDRRELLARDDRMWQRADAELVRALTGGQSKAHAARVLGISEKQVGRILAADDRRREELAEEVRCCKEWTE